MAHTTLSNYPSWLPALNTGFSKHRDALLLTTILTVGLTFVTPALALLVDIPALVLVVLVGAGYGILALLLRRVVAGLYVAFAVTATFAANVPLASQAYLATFSGHLGPELWLMQLPLAGIAAYLVFTTAVDDDHERDPSRTEIVLGGFVVWVGLSANFGAVVRPNAALFFGWLMAQAVIAFVAVRHAVQTDVLSFRTVIETLTIAVAAQAAVAVVQFFNRGILGVGPLGELAHVPIATISLGPLGEFASGTYVAGFTGMSFILAALLVLVVPVVLAAALRATGWRRWALVGAAVVMTAVLRATGTDAGRGGLAVAVGAFAVILAILHRKEMAGLAMSSDRRTLTQILSAVLMACVGVAAFFYPSSDSGTASTVTTIGGGTGTSGGSTGGGSGTTTDPGVVETTLQNLTIPLFDLGGLGARLQQYVLGLDLFLEHPVFGIGAANFVYYSTDLGLPRRMPIHNIYIALLAETGLPGFVLFVTALVLVLWAGVRAAGTTTDASERLLLVGVLAGMVGYLAYQSLGYSLLSKIPSLFPFWILAGALVGVHARRS